VVSVADCEGDIQEGFLDALSRPAEERAEVLIHATLILDSRVVGFEDVIN
jgi:hypothetical protein